MSRGRDHTAGTVLIEAVVTDFDKSLVPDQGTLDDPATLAELRALRRAGIRIVLCTGRTLDYLVGPTGIRSWDHLLLFDAIVAENGAVLWDARNRRLDLLGEAVAPEFVEALRRTGRRADPERRIDPAEIWPGLASVSVMRDRLDVSRDVLRVKNSQLRRKRVPSLQLHPIVNGGSVTWVSRGVDKGVGMLEALRRLGVDPARTVGVGDGENDAAFMRLCGLAAPVDGSCHAVVSLPNAIPLRGGPGAAFRDVARRTRRGSLDRYIGRGRIAVALG